MLQTSDVTTGEITRNLLEIKDSVKELTAAVEQRPNWEDLQRHGASLSAEIKAETRIRELERAQADKAIKATEDAINALEDWNKWALRTVGAAVLVSAVGWVLTGGMV